MIIPMGIYDHRHEWYFANLNHLQLFSGILNPLSELFQSSLPDIAIIMPNNDSIIHRYH